MENKLNYNALNRLIIISTVVIVVMTVVFAFNDFISLVGKIISALSPFIIGFVLAYIIRPLDKFLFLKLRISRKITSSVSLIVIIAVLSTIILAIMPLVSFEIVRASQNFPEAISNLFDKVFEFYIALMNSDSLSNSIDIENTLQKFETEAISFVQGINFENLIADLFNRIVSILGGLVSLGIKLFFIVLTTIYVLNDYEKINTNLVYLFPKKFRKLSRQYLNNVNAALRAYMRGLAIISTYVAVISGVGFSLIGLERAIILGVICGMFNIIPYLGPYIGGFPAVVLALATGGIALGALAVLVIVVAQLVENFLVTPYVQSKGLNVHPIFVLVFIVSGGSLFGLLGIILAIPALAITQATINFYITNKKEIKKIIDEHRKKPEEVYKSI